MKKIILAAALMAALATPAFADPNCMAGDGAGLHVEMGFSVGEFSEQDQMDFDVIRARRHGIAAQTAERTWLGCLKITRLDENGHWVTEYYDPDTFQSKPLDLRLPD